MDAVKFLREWKRMCKENTNGVHIGSGCNGDCPFLKARNSKDGECKNCRNAALENTDESIKIVEQWSKEHPQKTRMQDLLEKHPNAIIDLDGTPASCCRHLGYIEKCTGGLCIDCWNQPVEED